MRDLFEIFSDEDYSRVKPRDDDDRMPMASAFDTYEDDQLQELDINELKDHHEED